MRLAVSLLAGFFVIALPCGADIRVVDDTGETVVLREPAQRIVSLAPHVTELLFSIGAGDRVIAATDFSDYPPAARAIPRIGGSRGIDVERLVSLEPDLIVGWASGNSKRTVEQLRRLGFPIFLSEPRKLQDIADGLEKLGLLVARTGASQRVAERFVDRRERLAARYRGHANVRVFYQVLDNELITVNGQHLLSEALRLCGAENVFASLPVLAPVVSEEAVLDADPEAIVAGGTPEVWQRWRARWQQRQQLTAVRRGALYRVSPDLLHRHTVRILDGIEQLCEAVDDARRKR